MSEFVFGGGSVGPSKEDLSGLGVGQLLKNHLMADELNKINQYLTDLKVAVSAGDWHGIKSLLALPAVAPAGQSRMASYLNRLWHSQDGQAWQALGRHANDRDHTYFGIKANGTDDTAGWQAAMNWLGDQSGAGNAKPGRLTLPPTGISLVTDTITYTGSVGYAFLLEALGGPSYGQTGFQLKWAPGSGTGKPLLRIRGANGCLVKRINLNGSSLSKYLLHIDNKFEEGGTGAFRASSNVLIDECTFYDHGGVGCACIAVGNDAVDVANTQTSEVVVRNSVIRGRNLSGDCTGYGFTALTAGNCKNFMLENCHFGANGVHAQLGGSGYAVVKGGTMGLASVACIQAGAANLRVECVDYEGDPSGPYQAHFIDGGLGSQPTAVCTVLGCEAVAPLPAGRDGVLDDVMIRWPGPLLLLGNTFINNRGDGTHPAKVVAGAGFGVHPLGGNFGTVTSIGNFYQGSDQDVPVYDGSANLISGGGGYPTYTEHSVFSLNDLGGTIGAGLRSLRNVVGAPLETKTARMRAWGDSWGATVYKDGATSGGKHQKLLTHTTFTNSGVTEMWKQFANLNPRQRLKGVRAQVTQAFTGVAGSVVVRLGYWPIDPLPQFLGDVLKPFSITALGTFGDKPEHLGAGLAPEFIQPGGYYPAGADPNTGWTLFVSCVSEAGNPLTFSAGKLLITLFTEGDD